jgi:hypothetical protein
MIRRADAFVQSGKIMDPLLCFLRRSSRAMNRTLLAVPTSLPILFSASAQKSHAAPVPLFGILTGVRFLLRPRMDGYTMRKMKLSTAVVATLWAASALAADKAPQSLPPPDPSNASTLTIDDQQTLTDLVGTVGTFRKCRPAICAFFGITAKHTTDMSEIHCDIPSGDRVSFDMFSEAASGYLFSLTLNKRNSLFVIHTDTHLKLLAAIKTGTEESGNVAIEQLTDEAPAMLFAVASRALHRCIQNPAGLP